MHDKCLNGASHYEDCHCAPCSTFFKNFCFAENFKKMTATFKKPFSNVTREKIKAVKKFVP